MKLHPKQTNPLKNQQNPSIALSTNYVSYQTSAIIYPIKKNTFYTYLYFFNQSILLMT